MRLHAYMMSVICDNVCVHTHMYLGKQIFNEAGTVKCVECDYLLLKILQVHKKSIYMCVRT